VCVGRASRRVCRGAAGVHSSGCRRVGLHRRVVAPGKLSRGHRQYSGGRTGYLDAHAESEVGVQRAAAAHVPRTEAEAVVDEGDG